MALIISGKTRCVACGEVLQKSDEVTMLPHFATGPDDPLWRYSDGGFHRACYEALPERADIEARLATLK